MLPCIHKLNDQDTDVKLMTATLPNFPFFRKFTFDDVSWYYDFYIKNGLNPYADINQENLLVWLNMKNDLEVSILNGSVIFKYTNVLHNNRVNVIPLEKTLNGPVINGVMSYLKYNGLPLEIREIPSVICNDLDDKEWVIEDDRDSYEYILNTHQQSSLEGGDFCRHRRRLNVFEREHANDKVDIQYYHEFNDEIIGVFIQHINGMAFNNSEEASKENLLEPIAIRRNINYAKIFHKKALIIKINGQVVSISMISLLDEHTAVINHLKVNYSVQHIFQYTIYQLAKILKENGINEMNIEQDLGIEGLRAYKERLKPSRYLEKKIITPRFQ